MPSQEEAHLRILKIVTAQPDITQRELAERLGVSLGKTNFLVNSLIEKGLLKIGNFRRAESKLKKCAYLLTPAGIGERVVLARAYLARKEAEYEILQAEIRALKQEIGSTSYPLDDGQIESKAA